MWRRPGGCCCSVPVLLVLSMLGVLVTTEVSRRAQTVNDKNTAEIRAAILGNRYLSSSFGDAELPCGLAELQSSTSACLQPEVLISYTAALKDSSSQAKPVTQIKLFSTSQLLHHSSVEHLQSAVNSSLTIDHDGAVQLTTYIDHVPLELLAPIGPSTNDHKARMEAAESCFRLLQDPMSALKEPLSITSAPARAEPIRRTGPVVPALDCPVWHVADGRCDAACNLAVTDYDGGDCSRVQVKSVGHLRPHGDAIRTTDRAALTYKPTIGPITNDTHSIYLPLDRQYGCRDGAVGDGVCDPWCNNIDYRYVRPIVPYSIPSHPNLSYPILSHPRAVVIFPRNSLACISYCT